jgi:protein-tyrosine phosphatase
MVDIHCHILPGIDDGSDSWETTLEMCRIAADDGITHIVATPHANEEFMYSRNGHGKLLEEMKARVPSMHFTLGCDFHMSYENIEDALLDPAPFAIGNTKYILVEFNDFTPSQQMTASLFRLRSGELIPIITHPEGVSQQFLPRSRKLRYKRSLGYFCPRPERLGQRRRSSRSRRKRD